MKKRSERIGSELERSREDKESAGTEAAAIRAQLGDVASETARILAEADETAARMVVEGKERTKAEIAELEANTRAELAAIRARVEADVRAYVAAAGPHQALVATWIKAVEDGLGQLPQFGS